MDKERRVMWSCTGAKDSATLPWYGLQTILEQAGSDVLILQDCCAAASCMRESGNGATEVIAASGFETCTPDTGEHCFTRCLIDTLGEWEDRYPRLCGAVLHSEVLLGIKSRNRKHHENTQHQHTEAAERGISPIHITVSNQDIERSIVLSPMESAPELSAEPTSSPVSEESIFKSICGQPKDYPTVLLALALEDDPRLATSDWAKWLQCVPELMKYGHVEGIFRSGSILVLLSLPVPMWDLLPNDPAVRFRSFVKSHDLMKEELEIDYRTLNKE